MSSFTTASPGMLRGDVHVPVFDGDTENHSLQNVFEQGKLHLTITSPMLNRYWRNNKKELACFPACKQFGDYFKAKLDKVTHAKVPNNVGPCRGPVTAEVPLDHDVAESLGADLSTATKNIVAFMMVSPLVSGVDVDPSATSPCGYEAGQRVELSDFPVSNRFQGSATIQENKLCLEFAPKNWVYDHQLSKKRRRNDDVDLQMHAYVIVLLHKLKDHFAHDGESHDSPSGVNEVDTYYQVIAMTRSDPFQVESTKTLTRRLQLLDISKSTALPQLSKAFLYLMQGVPFATMYNIGIVCDDQGQLVTLESDKIKWITKSCLHLWKYTMEERIGAHMWPMMYPEDIPALASAEANQSSEFDSFMVMRRICKDGTLRWVRCQSRFFPDSLQMLAIEHEFDHESNYAELQIKAKEFQEKSAAMLVHYEATVLALRRCVNELYSAVERSSGAQKETLFLAKCKCEDTFVKVCLKLGEQGLLKPFYLFNVAITVESLHTLQRVQQKQIDITDVNGETTNLTVHPSIKLAHMPSIKFSNYENYDDVAGLVKVNRSLFFGVVSMDGYLLWVSDACTPLFGFEESELLYTNYWHMIHRNDVPMMVDRRNFGRFVSAKYRRRCKNGSFVWVEAYWHAYRGGEFDVLVERVLETGYKSARDTCVGLCSIVDEVGDAVKDSIAESRALLSGNQDGNVLSAMQGALEGVAVLEAQAALVDKNSSLDSLANPMAQIDLKQES